MSAPRPERKHPDSAELEQEREATLANVGAQIAQAICRRTHELGSHFTGVQDAIRKLASLPEGPEREAMHRTAEERLSCMSAAYGRELVGAALEAACMWIDLDELAAASIEATRA